ncbi:hypothetical protein SAMN04487761_1372 [Lachnospiraceae bacterium C7]|nr:hypothetical protein SAMN04487761_1372 [Lachnospiraceae bacterium C7]
MYRPPKVRPKNLTIGGRYKIKFFTVLFVNTIKTNLYSQIIINKLLFINYYSQVIIDCVKKFV